MESKPSWQIERFEEGFVVSLGAKGTLQESPSFRSFAADCLETGLCVVVDLSNCGYLDSTFLGCLIGLHKQSLKFGGNRFRLFASQSCRLQVLATSGLHTLFDYVDEYPKTTGESLTLDFGKVDTHTLGRHVMASHRLLADIDGKDSDRFRAIADRLGQELDTPPSS